MRGFLMNPLFDRRSSDMLPYSHIPFGMRDLMLYDFPKMFSELDGRSISVDVKEDDTSYKVSAELPGCDKNNISVDMDDDVLKISASYEDKKEEKKESYLYRECSSGTFTRSLVLPNSDKEGITAKYVDGVLHIDVLKCIKKEKENKKIEIE